MANSTATNTTTESTDTQEKPKPSSNSNFVGVVDKAKTASSSFDINSLKKKRADENKAAEMKVEKPKLSLKEEVLLPRKYEKPKQAVAPSKPDWKPASDPKRVEHVLSQFRGFVMKFRQQKQTELKKKAVAGDEKFLGKSEEEEPVVESKEVEVKIDKITRKGQLAINFN